MPKLVVVEGPNRGAVIRLLPQRSRIGRDQDVEIALPDDGVSRVHAEVRHEAGRFLLADAASKNGTFLNGIRVATPCELAHGDEVRAGDSVLVFVGDDEDDPVARPGDTASLPESGPAAPRKRRDVPPGRATAMVGDSAATRKIAALVERVAPLDTTVLIQGESGTGKELVAEGLHRLSPRRSGAFVAVNCANLEPRLLESELFGHERGAFTGAVARRLGKLELARGGTLFLDEVGELPLEAQAKLLRALERREFQRVGGHDVLTTDARLVAATNRDLARLASEGRFRDDLRFRLEVVKLEVAPLRERADDLRPLVEHFVATLRERIPTPARRFSKEALEHLSRYRFPGNVRELRNLVERCLIFADGEEVQAQDLPPEVRGGAPAAPEAIVSLEALERAHIERALAASGGNKTKVAGLLGIDRATLYAKLKRYGIPS